MAEFDARQYFLQTRINSTGASLFHQGYLLRQQYHLYDKDGDAFMWNQDSLTGELPMDTTETTDDSQMDSLPAQGGYMQYSVFHSQMDTIPAQAAYAQYSVMKPQMAAGPVSDNTPSNCAGSPRVPVSYLAKPKLQHIQWRYGS
ncbi:uncharacterized protein LOC124261462 isoform X1 [Haliotis rubra]|uniref:uncharacterized protein LOC124261462 isoform X1 n=1 Tax=Haliotis rubra TaxID=36100 RepID=UPI001EE6152C|nr:uncharacterized protein LOC124261462 isoform X1 [Haliotis rubra]